MAPGSTPTTYSLAGTGDQFALESQFLFILASAYEIGTVLGLPGAFIYFISEHCVSILLKCRFPVSEKTN